jgi:hypothetical protein
MRKKVVYSPALNAVVVELVVVVIVVVTVP